MNHSIVRSLAVGLVAAGLNFNACAGSPSGEVDFGKFAAPAKGGEFVEVNVRSNLISLAATLVEKEQPDAAKILRSVQLVRVNVVGLTDENRDDLQKRVQQIRADLDTQGWEHNVNVKGKNGEDVGVYTRTRGGEALAGIAITVMDKEHVVLVNVVGDIKPDQIAALGESLKITPLKDIGDKIKK